MSQSPPCVVADACRGFLLAIGSCQLEPLKSLKFWCHVLHDFHFASTLKTLRTGGQWSPNITTTMLCNSTNDICKPHTPARPHSMLA